MTVYTAIIGEYDYVKPLAVPQRGGLNYVLFTDQPHDSIVFKYYNDQPEEGKIWDIRKIEVMDCGPAKTARRVKIMFHEYIDDEFSIWLDGTFVVNTDIARWWRKRFRPPFTCVSHPFDDCAYTDAFSCMRGGRGDRCALVDQVKFYRDEGLPEHAGLIASGILMRQNTREVRKLCTAWWEQVERFSERDQIAFGYAAWRNPGVHDVIQWDYTTQHEFKHVPHRHKEWGENVLKKIIKC